MRWAVRALAAFVALAAQMGNAQQGPKRVALISNAILQRQTSIARSISALLVAAPLAMICYLDAVAQMAPADPPGPPTQDHRHTQNGDFLSLSKAAAVADADGDHVRAEQLWRDAVTAADRRTRSREAAILRGRLAQNLSIQGRYAEADVLFRQILAEQKARHDAFDEDTGTALNNLASNLDAMGDYAAAEPLYRQALDVLESKLGTFDPKTASVLNNLALNLDAQGRAKEAEQLYRRVLSTYQILVDNHEHLADAAKSLNNLALNLEEQGRGEEAEPLYRRALNIRRKAGISTAIDDNETALISNNLAANLLALGRIEEAETLAVDALATEQSRLGPHHPNTASVMNTLARILRTQGRLVDAERYAQDAVDAFKLTLGRDHPQTAAGEEALALLQLEKLDTGAALDHGRNALRGWQSVHASAINATKSDARNSSGSSRAASIVARAAFGLGATDPAHSPGLRAEAFEATQVSGASSAADALAQGAARIAAERVGAGPAVGAWRGAQDRIGAIDAQIAQAAGQGTAGDARRAALGGERATAVTLLATAERDLSARFPRYFDLLKAVPVSVADLQETTGEKARLLGADEALVALTPGDSRMPEGQRKGLVFVVTKTTSAWAEIPLEPAALVAEIVALHAMLAQEGAGATRAADKLAPTVTYDRARAFALYRALFGAPDIQAALAGKTRWLIAPQGPLMSLPLAALPMAAPSGSDTDPAALRATAWLGTERTLAILPSVSALRVQRLYPLERFETERTPFFGVGDPAFRGIADGDTRSGGAGLQAARSYFRGGVADQATFSLLPRLPNTAREIRTLANNLGAASDSYVLQLDATEAELRQRNADRRLEHAEVIAFATHGLVAGEFQNSIAEPALALTPPMLAAGGQLTSDNDGLLTASEAATLTLSARFVILSACNTAAGGKADADALSGLARAFFYAGAQSLLVSHYPVFDDAAMLLTTEAARLARTGMRNPEAVRASMRKLEQDPSADAEGRSFAHPAAWAPFAVIDAN